MSIVSPEKMDFSQKHIILIVAGLPGTWKSTTALSAPNSLLCDFDDGLARIKPEHRKDAIICKTYEEFLADIKTAQGKYETVIIDTCGSLIELMKDWAMRTDPKASKKDGGFSLQGYGIIKQEFLRLSNELRKQFNVIYLFHEQVTRNGDGGVFYDLIADGSCKVIAWQPADLGGHLFIQNGKHYIGFTPTEEYSAKAAYGINGIIEIPELKDGEPNVFLTQLFARVRSNLAAEKATVAPQKQKYDVAISEAKNICSCVNAPDDVQYAVDAISKLEHAMTSEKESKAMLKKRLEELGIVWNKSTKSYEFKG